VQDRVHQAFVIHHHGALTRGEDMGLSPPEPDADAQGTDLGGIVDCTGVPGDVETGDAEPASRLGDFHDGVEHGRGSFVVGIGAVASSFEADTIDRRIHFRDAQNLFDLFWERSPRSEVDGLATEACRLSEPLGVQVPHDDRRGPEELGGMGARKSDRTCPGNVDRGPRTNAGGVGAVEPGGEDVRKHR
jgi:hypothetical protein